MKSVRALVITGYGLNCDYETHHTLKLAGADPCPVHINDLIAGNGNNPETSLDHYHIMVFGGGFAWADDHGAGVILATKLKYNLGQDISAFVQQGKLIIGICNGFQSLVNLGLLPGFDGNYRERRLALIGNDSGNFIDAWVNLKINKDSPCVFTKGIATIEMPVRHGEGKFYAAEDDIRRLAGSNQVVMQYADREGDPAEGRWPENPNGSLHDIAGVCDPTGRIFGLMPHPEAFHHVTNHPEWTLRREILSRQAKDLSNREGDGVIIFRNAVEFCRRK